MTKLKKVFCTNCSRPIFRSAGRINENLKFGHNFYCSIKCLSEYRTKKQKLVCENSFCNKRFLREPSDISPHNYCSRSCAAKVNGKKYPKRKARVKICANVLCDRQFKGKAKYCSIKCASLARQRYTRQDLIDIIKLFVDKIERVPVKRELKEVADACAHLFGSWNKDIIAAGFQPNRSHSQRMYRCTNTKALDGHMCDSTSEAIIDDWFTANGIPHKRNVSYPETNHKADWSIENGKVFIEYFGLANDSPRYDRAMQKKIQLCQSHKIKLIEIYPSDLYPKACLDSRLRNEISDL